ncbi:MAG: hypothetical protein J6A25_11190, partial [Lachnospiraceae bacterium]|nr:hypothetical protein [Lachnospiraceae bacterium]
MKKIKNLFKKLNNRGSSIVMVIVSLGFIGIVIGALVAAAGYAYRLKLQNLNAKDNFYYVEQAMQEIYAGVGANTIEEMKEAYTYTVENMVRFDPTIGTYVTLDDEEANKMFKKRFMENIKGSPYFSQGNDQLATVLESYITNETVDLDNSKIVLAVQEVVVQEATADTPAITREEIVIKNVTLTRIQDYDNVTGGTYTQTISADIVISEPDFAVKFNNMTTDYSAIFEYAIIGDMGIQIVNNDGVDILGNIYAASDFYNKSYNANTSLEAADQKHTYTANGVEYSYNITPVTSKKAEVVDAEGTVTGTDYVNQMLDATNVASYKYDGENTYSMNSGLYISNSSVNIMADRVIVPGTVAVMDSSDILVYGSAGVIAEVWADNIVLGGSSVVTPKSTGSTEVDYNGSEAIFSADLYVRDDTEINAKGAKFTLHGSYYGYGNSTSKDTRVFVPTVATAEAAGGESDTYNEN